MAGSCLSRCSVKVDVLDPLAETTPIERVFGGSLRSQVRGYLQYTVRTVWQPFYWLQKDMHLSTEYTECDTVRINSSSHTLASFTRSYSFLPFL